VAGNARGRCSGLSIGFENRAVVEIQNRTTVLLRAQRDTLEKRGWLSTLLAVYVRTEKADLRRLYMRD